MPPKCLLPASSGGSFDDEGVNSSSSSGAALPHQHDGAVQWEARLRSQRRATVPV